MDREDFEFFEDEKHYNISKSVNTSQVRHNTTYQNNRNAIKHNPIKIKSVYRHAIKINFGRKGRL